MKGSRIHVRSRNFTSRVRGVGFALLSIQSPGDAAASTFPATQQSLRFLSVNSPLQIQLFRKCFVSWPTLPPPTIRHSGTTGIKFLLIWESNTLSCEVSSSRFHASGSGSTGAGPVCVGAGSPTPF